MTSDRQLEAMDTEQACDYIRSGKADAPRQASIRFATCADCRKPIARDEAAPTHCCEGDCGWYHVKLADTWKCQGTSVHIRPHNPNPIKAAMDAYRAGPERRAEQIRGLA